MSKSFRWDERFMQLTETVAGWSSCFQENRHVGAIIVRDKRVMTTGYNGAPAGVKSCEEKGECLRRKLNVPSGTKQELCFAVHAEQNAVIQAARYGINVSGATLYCTHQPCVICAKIIINAGITRVVYKEGYPDEFSLRLFEEAGVKVEKYADLLSAAECESADTENEPEKKGDKIYEESRNYLYDGKRKNFQSGTLSRQGAEHGE